MTAFAEAGINNETEIVALGGDGHLWHSVIFPQYPGSTAGVVAPKTDLTGAGRPLANITQVSAVSIGWELHVVVVAAARCTTPSATPAAAGAAGATCRT
ncbi:hypothetical protein ACFQ1I_00275 [Kitasatospora arboriphila]